MADSGLRAFGACLAVACGLLLAGCGGAESRKQHFLERGREYLAQGRYDKASIEFRNALQIAPNDAEARYENGVAAEDLAAYGSAVQLYQGALDVAPSHLEARRHLARLLLLGGRFQMALDTVKPGLAKYPNDSVMLGVRAGARARMEADVTQPVMDAERAVQIDPHNADAVEILAGLYTRQNRPDDTVRILERGVTDNPKSIPLRLTLADYYSQHQHPDQSERLLKEIIALAPANTDYRIALARFYSSRDQVDEAEATLRKGLAALPDNPALTQGLIDLLHARRGAPAAERELRTMIAANPKNDDLYFVLAGLFLSDRQTDKARDVLQAVVNRQDSTAAVLHAQSSLAALKLAANDVPGAQAIIDQVLASDERNRDALQVRARIALLQQRPGDAIVDLRSALKDQPDDPAALRLLVQAHLANREPALALEVLQRAVDSNPTNNSLRLDLVSLLMKEGKADQAEQLAATLVQREPRNVQYLRAAFGAQLANRNVSAATQTADSFVALVPERPEGYYLAGLAADAAHQSDVAVGKFEKSLEIAPAAHEPLEALVRLYGREGKVSLALQRLDRFASAQPKDPEPKVLAGELLLAQKKLPDAASAFRAAMALDPGDFPAYRGLASAQVQQHDVDGAAQTLRAAQTHVHAPEMAVLELGSLYQSVGRTADAEKAYQEALQLNPRLDLAANNLAMLLVGGNADPADVNRAMTLVQRFTDSTDPFQIDTLGWVRLKHGETNSALQLLGKAVDLAPEMPAIRYHFAMAQLKAGQTANARANLQQALRASDTFEGVGDARAVLASLQPVASALH